MRKTIINNFDDVHFKSINFSDEKTNCDEGKERANILGDSNKKYAFSLWQYEKEQDSKLSMRLLSEIAKYESSNERKVDHSSRSSNTEIENTDFDESELLSDEEDLELVTIKILDVSKKDENSPRTVTYTFEDRDTPWPIELVEEESRIEDKAVLSKLAEYERITPPSNNFSW
ncbi:MAG: hypothetical protein VX335_03985 [Pseudomonadota bacterium]|nr:hypothetical protein [Pseudomonadota bacterium]